MPRTLLAAASRALLVAIAYTLVSRFGLAFVVKPEGMAAFWPPAGFMLAVMVLSPKRTWPANLVGSFVGCTVGSIIFFHNGLLVSMGFGFFNSCESLLTSWLLLRVLGAPITMTRLSELIGLTVLAAILGNAVTATGGAVVVTTAFGAPYWAVWRVWWMGDALGMLLFTPVIVSWATVRPEEIKPPSPQRSLEAALLFIASWVVTYLVFSSTVRGTSFLLPLPYVTFPFLLWAAVRFGPRGASLAALTTAFIAVWYTANGSGPFAALSESTSNKLLSAQGFLAAAVLSSLMLAVVIHERKQAEEALRTTNESLEVRIQERTKELAQSNLELEQFAYVSSHDLQEPLRAVAGTVQIFQRRYASHVDAQADELITHITEGVSRMQALINDLLAFSRVGSRSQPLVATDCSAVMKDVASNLAVAVQESGAVVTYDGLPTVMSDPTQMTQLLQNLIGNAIKFRGGSRPEIQVKAEKKDGDWLFSVRDNGIGIEPQYYDRIFGIFQRLHTRREYPGTGIGLAICKKIVERQGGRIWVESERGRGTCFFFTLPLQAGDSRAAA
ncbi:MAG TPA: MASE1 domain-containing protein [Myxococcales bacterium]|nr:MASE1 domain-containing protein [Myxococcales bacterium]